MLLCQPFYAEVQKGLYFYNSHLETAVHLFCFQAKQFWGDVSRLFIDHLSKGFVLWWENVVFGFHNYAMKEG